MIIAKGRLPKRVLIAIKEGGITKNTHTLQFSVINTKVSTWLKRHHMGGVGYPLHGQKLLKSGLLINCEDERCQEEIANALQLGMNERECSHLMLVYNAFYPQPFTLNEDKLI